MGYEEDLAELILAVMRMEELAKTASVTLCERCWWVWN